MHAQMLKAVTLRASTCRFSTHAVPGLALVWFFPSPSPPLVSLGVLFFFLFSFFSFDCMFVGALLRFSFPAALHACVALLFSCPPSLAARRGGNERR